MIQAGDNLPDSRQPPALSPRVQAKMKHAGIEPDGLPRHLGSMLALILSLSKQGYEDHQRRRVKKDLIGWIKAL